MIGRKAYSHFKKYFLSKGGQERQSREQWQLSTWPHQCGVCGSHVDSCHMNMNGRVVRQSFGCFVDCCRGCRTNAEHSARGRQAQTMSAG
eukprot:1303763-Pleurochrysis_carterae.AAC.1